VLRSLKKNDVSPVVIHWALERETRMLAELAFIRRQNRQVSAADYRRLGVWQNRQATIQAALNRWQLSHWEHSLQSLSAMDRMIKGRLKGDVWTAMERWILSFKH
jgi:DNA polymerase-3 subunit delta